MWRLLLSAIALSLACRAQAAEQTVDLATGEWPPYVSQQLPEQGVFAEIVREAFRRAGYQARMSFQSWPQTELLTKSGKAAAAFPYRPTPEREKDFDFSVPLMHSTSYLFYHKPHLPNPPQQFQSLDELRSYRIAIQLGYWYLPLFQRHRLNTLMTSDETNALRQLYLGHLDLVPMVLERGLYQIHHVFPGREKEFSYISTPLDKETALALMFSRSYPQAAKIREDFGRALAQMEKDGSLKAIYQRHFPEATPPR
ncbi:substrate-binding periplasmic protein [Chromobacterium piscinae]|uniref:Transporter substrate-binding domain-containing protein n=1 Tax=Chromobacterium piscinae TaxID=686831 RepID=A0ABV0H0Y4_9NEIS|nr:transporter substrate-binding domain-containing protein [Chromobacterium piscinae]MBX9296485.1 transporter substrate-binding domain-containing protein [Chromobacterium vaccinii]MBX9346158.1 transporter substrate-binding domain-containing protein [Chromobacterium vaccinii]MBX9355265.1 transporter substrate-binding domain-containing protein [Chromobacterium vaccinii]MCD4503046.1 transporter substrate-binding domain-containing protein [Chromobacterium piscinae]MCD5327613.1 transporter substrat